MEFKKERSGVYYSGSGWTDGSGWKVHKVEAGQWELRLFNVKAGVYPSLQSAINAARVADGTTKEEA